MEAVTGERRPIPSAQLPCDPIAESAVDLRLHKLGIQDFVILNPGAGWGAKQWPPERYGELAVALSDRGLRPIINFGPGEQELASAAESAGAGSAVALSLPISELVALTRRARLFIGGDTGPMGHVGIVLAIAALSLIVYLSYAYAPRITARISPQTAHGILRVIAFVLLCIGVQITWNGVEALLKTLLRS